MCIYCQLYFYLESNQQSRCPLRRTCYVCAALPPVTLLGVPLYKPTSLLACILLYLFYCVYFIVCILLYLYLLEGPEEDKQFVYQVTLVK